MLKAQEKDLSKEYRDLKRVEVSLDLANTPEFTHGPLFTKEELEPAETVEIREEKEQELEASQEAPSGSQPISKENELWDGLDELFSSIWSLWQYYGTIIVLKNRTLEGNIFQFSLYRSDL